MGTRDFHLDDTHGVVNMRYPLLESDVETFLPRRIMLMNVRSSDPQPGFRYTTADLNRALLALRQAIRALN
jgi:hypothetical protein